MTAEEFLQKICNVIENALRGAKLKETPNDDDEGPTNLIDLLSAGETIDEGKEEIGNIVEQIYFALKESKAMEEYSQSLHPLFSREELEKLTLKWFIKYYPAWKNPEYYSRIITACIVDLQLSRPEVKLPNKKTPTREGYRDHVLVCEGWNDCIDEIKKLNSIK